MDKYIAVPFTVDDVYEGFAEIDGLLGLDENSLKLDYQTRDSIFGVVKSAIKNIRINYSEILSIEFKKGMFSSKIIITTSTFISDKIFPKAQGNEFILKIKSKHKVMASQLVSLINLRQSEQRLSEAENM